MEEFLRDQTNYTLKQYLRSTLAAHKKVLEKLFTQHTRILEGYTPIQRLAYIVNLQDYEILQKLYLLLRKIEMGTVSLTCHEFDCFLLEHSTNDDYSDDSCVEELAL